MGRKFRDLKTTYTSGELDPALAAREDIKHYYNGADRLRNVLVIPQGGARRRGGLRYVAELWHKIERFTTPVISVPNGGTAANANDNDSSTLVTTTVGISTTNPYVVVQYDLGTTLTIRAVDVIALALDAGTSSDFYVQYSTDGVSFTNFGPVLGTVSTTAITRRRSGTDRAAVDARYIRLARIGATDLTTSVASIQEMWVWTETAELSSARLVEFQYSDVARYLIVLTEYNAAVYLDGEWQTDITFPLTALQITQCNWTQSLDTLIVFHQSKQTFKLYREGDDTVWGYYPIDYERGPGVRFPDTTDFDGVSFTLSATTGSITVTAGSAIFTTAHIGGYMTTYKRAGVVRFTGYTNSTHMTGEVLDDFSGTGAFTDAEFRELAFSDTRGWPSCGTFHGERLVVGHTDQLPQHVFMSRVGKYFDFNDAQSLDDYGIIAELASDKVSSIYNIVSARHLHILTSSAEWYVMPNDAPITPDTVAFKRATETGSLAGLRWASVEGATMFVQRGGKSVREFVFIDTEQDYQANNVSLLSSHLIDVPVDFAQRKATATDEGDLVLACNSDGTCAALSTLRTQDVTAWSLLVTQGNFLNVAEDGQSIFFVVDRTVDGVTRRYLEQMDNDVYTDCCITGTITSETYTATAGQTIFNYLFADPASASLVAVRVNGVILDYITDYQVTLATNTVELEVACADGDTVEIFSTVSEVTGLDHLEGWEVQVRIDGSVSTAQTVTGGAITLASYPLESYEIGIKFADVRDDGDSETWIRDMPIALQLADGTLTGEFKGVTSMTAKVQDTQDIWLGANGEDPEEVILRDFGELVLNQGAPVFTGNVTIEAVLGYDEFGQTEVVQRVPAPMTLLGMAKTVDM